MVLNYREGGYKKGGGGGQVKFTHTKGFSQAKVGAGCTKGLLFTWEVLVILKDPAKVSTLKKKGRGVAKCFTLS